MGTPGGQIPVRYTTKLGICYECATVIVMDSVAARNLRNDTAGLLRRVQAGEEVIITVHGRPVAELVPLRAPRCDWLPRAELAKRLRDAQADAALRQDLARLAGDTTDDLGPIR